VSFSLHVKVFVVSTTVLSMTQGTSTRVSRTVFARGYSCTPRSWAFAIGPALTLQQKNLSGPDAPPSNRRGFDAKSREPLALNTQITLARAIDPGGGVSFTCDDRRRDGFPKNLRPAQGAPGQLKTMVSQ
jgi:hypothetical protein